MQLIEKLVNKISHVLVAEVFYWSPCHVGQSMSTEVSHNGVSLVERVPKSTGPVSSNLGRMLDRPFPRKHALAVATDCLEEQDRVRVSRDGPTVQDLDLHRATYEFVRADIGRSSIEGWGPRHGGRIGLR